MPLNLLNTWLQEQWAQAATPFTVIVEGAEIACRGWNLEATDLPPVILVHGFRAHAQWWDHIAPSLARAHRVVALSLSGMGDSDRRESYSRRQFGREIIAVAKTCGFGQVTLVAHSFGCLCAINAVDQAPGLFSTLVVIDAGLPIPGHPLHVIPDFAERNYLTREDASDHFRLIPAGGAPVPAIRKYIGDHSVRETAQGWTWKFDRNLPASLNAEDNWNILPKISVPMEIIHGQYSSIMTAERIAVAASLSDQVNAAIPIPTADHHIMVEQPVALVAVLSTLLGRTSG